MKKLSREDIRKLVKEVIQERWSDVLTTPIFKNMRFDFPPIKRKKDQIEMYDNFDDWLNEMVDGSGHYVGPILPNYFVPRDKYIVDTSIPHTVSNLLKMLEWNEAVGEQNGMSPREIFKFNSVVRQKFEKDNPKAYLGDLTN